MRIHERVTAARPDARALGDMIPGLSSLELSDGFPLLPQPERARNAIPLQALRSSGPAKLSSGNQNNGFGVVRPMPRRELACIRLSRLAFRVAAAGVALSFSSSAVRGQTVSGGVTEIGSGGALSGVLIQLLSADNATIVRSVLSDASGRFHVLAPAPGRYSLQGKRIGVQRWVSDVFTLEAGETRSFAIQLETLAARLPEVVVKSTSLCMRGGESAQQIAALWDEIDAALTATAITVEDSSHRTTIVRSSRVLDPRTRRLLAEQRYQVETTTGRPFSTIEPESLITSGYWHEADEDSAQFYGLDERVLNSSAFRTINCFHVARRPAPSRGTIGLGFEPQKTGNGVRGTIWLDSATFELREVDYSYTGIQRTQHSDQLGGVTRFGRLKTGGWIVREWSIRMPQYAVMRTTRGTERVYTTGGLASAVRVPIIQRIVEQGGSAHSDQLIATERAAAVRGVVQDSTGRPLPSATVSLLGTSVRVVTGSDGSFALRDVPEGHYAVVANDSASSDLGAHGAQQDIKVAPGDSLQLALRFWRGRELMTRLCKRDDLPPDRSALRLRLVDSLTNEPVTGSHLRLWWTEYSTVRGFRRASSQSVDGVTAKDGTMLACGLPSGAEVNFGSIIDHSRALPMGRVSLKAGSITTMVIRR